MLLKFWHYWKIKINTPEKYSHEHVSETYYQNVFKKILFQDCVIKINIEQKFCTKRNSVLSLSSLIYDSF